MLARLMVVVALVAGCSKTQDAPKEQAAAAKPAPADPSTLFTGKAPALPAEVAKLRFGGPKAAQLEAVGATSAYVPSKAAADVSYDLGFDKQDRLDRVSVRTAADLEPVLTKAWGPPVKTDKGVAFWFAPETGVRAYLPDFGKGKVVAFTPYQPVTALLAPQGIGLALAQDKPLFGATLDELRAAWGPMLCDFDEEAPKMKKAFEDNAKDSIARVEDYIRGGLKLCRDKPRGVEQYGVAKDNLRVGLDGRIWELHMSTQLDGAVALGKQLADQLDARFGGKPVEIASKDGLKRWYFDPAKKLRAVVSMDGNYLGVSVAPYLPVAELIGGDAKGLAIEGPHLPVGTFAEIAQDDPAHFRKKGELASLVYPPTELSSWQTEIELEMMAHAKRTTGYRVVLHHTGNEQAGDAVLELLKQKFGEPKRDKRSTDKDLYYTFKKAGRTVEARRVSEQWQLYVTK